MSNAAPRKFIFDTEFASDGTVVRAGDTFRQSYSRAEMETMTAAAFEKGKNDETARANAMMAEATRRIADSLQKLVGGLRDEALALRTEAADMALACAQACSTQAGQQGQQGRRGKRCSGRCGLATTLDPVLDDA